MSTLSPMEKMTKIINSLGFELDILCKSLENNDLQEIWRDYAAAEQAKRCDMELDVGLPEGWRKLAESDKKRLLAKEMDEFQRQRRSAYALKEWEAVHAGWKEEAERMLNKAACVYPPNATVRNAAKNVVDFNSMLPIGFFGCGYR